MHGPRVGERTSSDSQRRVAADAGCGTAAEVDHAVGLCRRQGGGGEMEMVPLLAMGERGSGGAGQGNSTRREGEMAMFPPKAGEDPRARANPPC